MIDTENDIKRRKSLAINAFNTYEKILTSKHISLDVRMRLFNTYITSIFMYNSELWILTKQREQEIDVFQRKLLRRLLKMHYPYKISNEDLYERTNEKSWHSKIEARRLRLLGHLLRLDEETTARKALTESMRKVKRPQGRPKETWLSMIEKQLKGINLSIHNTHNIIQLAENRKLWRCLTSGGTMPTSGE